MNCRSNLPRVCNWQSAKSHHRGWFTTNFKELETNQIIWSLEPTSDESNTDIIKELIETENRLTWPDMKPRSSVDTSSHIDHNVKNGFQSMVHLTVDLETESESESNRMAYGMQNLSSDEFSLPETVSRSSVCHYLGTEKELTGCPQTSGAEADVAIVISSDDDWEDDLKKKSLTLEEQIVQLKNKIGDLTRENKILKKQLFSSLKFEEQSKKLKDEIENLRQENQELSLSTNCLVTRLQNIVLDGTANTLDDEIIENNL
ncbi:hypothetical protein K7X08_037763 [Anisodus acutangulus]|uniref:Uncharacterized protein n=1 Tax=Anisodus acutangulus TaxID=402998 RepID=A0A9Q1RSB6_9SOLA|nr:hypothetical protein K7X08_037763 [Anisodus acutangulus]